MPSYKVTGHWQSIVWWLEWDGDGGLIQLEGVFESEEERDSHLSSRLETGNVYDLIGVVESSWTEVEGDLPLYEEDESLWAGTRRTDRDEWMGEKKEEEE